MAFTPYSAPPTSDISPVIGEVNDETTWPPYNTRRKPGQTVYLITGANRGLGLALTTTLALRPNTVVFACIRTFTPETTEILTSLPVGQDSYVAPLKIDATAPLHAKQAVEVISRTHGYDHVDVVIANSGISDYYGTAAETPLEALRTHFEVNTIGPLALFQAILPLLLQSAHPRFVAMSSGAASLGDMEHMPLMPITAYGASKAALNYIVRKIHFENQGVCSWVLSPGWVRTEMGNHGAEVVGMERAPVSLEQSVEAMIEKIDSATRGDTSGTFQSFDDTKRDW
ncbi:NAD(P)-binding protein [Aureobasidium pullulans]|uniref:NAD(P)-binding protein n=1 Tax=Aureobasidium pullulans TaxID=5580 RepID=A0A4S8S3G9_AURPU|nr:NAD(P)-binding protein [Aureobasidium pullulans]THX39757.1 NAD(P)-binding protein [Aureobasidium pullulans]